MFEVLLAVVLFAAAGAVIAGALSASMATLNRLRATTQAENLAVSILSQVQMGLLPSTSAGPEMFEPPFSQWTWELGVSEVGQPAFDEAEPLQRVEIIIRQVDGPTVLRLVQWLKEAKPEPGHTGPLPTARRPNGPGPLLDGARADRPRRLNGAGPAWVFRSRVPGWLS